jgi:hypothetical protein
VTSLVIEDERGVFTKTPHPHNGYYAGDFSTTPVATPPPVRPAAAEPVATGWDASRWMGPWTR